jgi:hypothetical protein
MTLGFAGAGETVTGPLSLAVADPRTPKLPHTWRLSPEIVVLISIASAVPSRAPAAASRLCSASRLKVVARRAKLPKRTN